MTTHDVGDIEHLCSRLVAIDHGHVTYDSTIEQLCAGRDWESAIKDLYTGESMQPAQQ